jgi:hypothetical protein
MTVPYMGHRINANGADYQAANEISLRRKAHRYNNSSWSFFCSRYGLEGRH